MKLYIGNATAQIHAFTYNAPMPPGANPNQMRLPRVQPIEPGGQTCVSGDFSRAEIDYITDQHRPYGLIEINDVPKAKPFVGICFSVDKPISREHLQRLMSHNMDVLVERGHEARKMAAVAATTAIEKDLKESQLPMSVKAVEFEVAQVESPRGTETGERMPSETILASRQPEDKGGRPDRRRPRR